MHSSVESAPGDALDQACDRVLDAFVDSFVEVNNQRIPSDKWLHRLIKELEGAREELRKSLARTTHVDYRKNLGRAIRRVENVLAQLYEEQLYR